MAFYKCGLPKDVKIETAPNVPANTTQKITLGFKPKKLVVVAIYNSNAVWCVYDEEVSTTSYKRAYTTSSVTTINFKTSGYIGIWSIENDGFNLISATYGLTNIYYMAE